MSKNFPDWLNSVLKDKNWSQSELARRAGVSRATISDVILGQEKPGRKLCVGIAVALNVPPEIVFRKAGILPPEINPDEKRQELIHLYDMMSEENKEDQIAYARMRLEKQEREARHSARRSHTSQNL